MDSTRKILGILIALLFVITAVLALIFFNLDRRAFTADTYRQVFANEGFYNRLPRVLAETMNSTSFNESELPLVMRGMGLKAWEAFFQAMLPLETLTEMGEQTLNSMFAYLNMETNSAEMSLLPLKRNMAGDAGVDAVFALLNTQQDCTLVQIAQMSINLLSTEDIQFCNPPEQLNSILTPVIAAQLQVLAFVIPDRVTLTSAAGIALDDDPRLGLQKLRRLMRLTPLFPLGLLLLLTVLMVNSLNSWLDWWGTPLLVTGITATLVGVSGSPLVGGILRRAITQRAPTYLPIAFSDYASDLGKAMVKTMMKPILFQGIVLAIIGSAMMVISNIIRQKQKNLPASEQETIVE